MSDQFRIDQIQPYVWALSQDWPSMPGGYDAENGHAKLKEMASGYKTTTQASLETLDRKLQHEMELDARHQQHFWLWVDRAIEAVGMLEADGLDIGNRGKIFANHYYDAHRETSKKNAFISLVKQNIDLYESQINQSNVVFEAAPNDPKQDAGEIADFNLYKTEVLNQNHFSKAQENQVHDFAAFGNGCLRTDYRIDEAAPDNMFLENRVREGEVIDFEEYMRYKNLVKAHAQDYVDCFEIIAHRNAAGADSWNIAGSKQHPYVHWVRQERIARLKREYPHVENKIRARTSDIYRSTNPQSFVTDENDEDQTTMMTTWIRFPVGYELTIPVRLANGDIVEKMDYRPRSAICRVDRIEGVGIVDMELDRFAHNMLPIVQAVNTPSTKHSRGIGLCKYGYAPQKVHQIMFNGQLRMFERMVKGGGWFFKGVISQSEIREQQKEGTWIGIDRDSLPQDLKNRPVDELVAENSPMQFPPVYQQMQTQAEQYVNTAMSAPPPSKGFKSGSSGRQDMTLINQSNQISSGGIRAYEACMMPLGEQVHNNIVQFDGDRLNLEFVTEDPENPSDQRKVVLNQVINEKVEFDPYAPEESMYERWKVIPTKIKNNLKSLKWTTQLSTRSLLPSNPTERRLFMRDFIQSALQFTESKRGIQLLRWLVESGLGGLPGFERRIEEIEASIDEDRQFQQKVAMDEKQFERQKFMAENQEKTEELRQNLMRLQAMEDDNKRQAVIDLLDTLVDAAEADRPINVNQLLERSKNTNLLMPTQQI